VNPCGSPFLFLTFLFTFLFLQVSRIFECLNVNTNVFFVGLNKYTSKIELPRFKIIRFTLIVKTEKGLHFECHFQIDWYSRNKVDRKRKQRQQKNIFFKIKMNENLKEGKEIQCIIWWKPTSACGPCIYDISLFGNYFERRLKGGTKLNQRSASLLPLV
jgi:hypothetical protein